MTSVEVPDPLGDPTFQRQKAMLAKTLADYDSSQGLARAQYGNTVNTNMRQLGWRNNVPRVGQRALDNPGQDGAGWDPTARGSAYSDAFLANQGDFAGRGMLHSGAYAQAFSDLQNDMNDRRAQVLTGQKDWEDTQAAQRRNFVSQQQATEQSALADAIAGIAARLGVNISDVVSGKSNTVTRSF